MNYLDLEGGDKLFYQKHIKNNNNNNLFITIVYIMNKKNPNRNLVGVLFTKTYGMDQF